jgi:hypothetical protein
MVLVPFFSFVSVHLGLWPSPLLAFIRELEEQVWTGEWENVEGKIPCRLFRLHESTCSRADWKRKRDLKKNEQTSTRCSDLEGLVPLALFFLSLDLY